ncbi:MAG: SGNH/GDSL hydrolase family protein [Verrucomicrobia bacterium]|nr:SGNH/GDSL hydrolase family protein [Verrucomicrobiota bacterium]
MNIICLGDSITHADNFAEGDRWPTVLQRHLDEWRPGTYKVYNRGISGHTTAEGLDRFETGVLPLLPAVVLVEFGFNDSYVPPWSRKARVGLEEFEANLREIHRAVRARKGTCVFIVNHTIGKLGGRGGNGRTHNTNIVEYSQAVRRIGAALRAPLIDLPTLMKRRKVAVERFVCKDKLHLSIEGNHIYAGFVFDSLRPMLK